MAVPFSSANDRLNSIPDYYRGVHVKTGMISPAAATYLHAAILSRLNILLLGPPAAGTMMLANALGKLLPENSDNQVLEDTSGNCFFFGSETTSSISSSYSPITQKDINVSSPRELHRTLRLMNIPDEGVLEVILTLISRQISGITTLQVASLSMLSSRVYLMLGLSTAGRQYDLGQVANLLSQAFHIVVEMQVQGHPRYITQIGEFTRNLSSQGDNSAPEISPIFRTDTSSLELKGPLCKSLFEEQFRNSGINPSIYQSH